MEQDASWHQVIIRDTSFTTSHIIAFYFTFPLYITMGVASYLYAMTRLPQFSKAVSFPLVGAIVGPMMICRTWGEPHMAERCSQVVPRRKACSEMH